MNILHIDSCALGDNSTSRRISAAAMAALTAGDQAASVRYRDLAAAPLSHASGPLLQAISQRWDSDIPMNVELRAEALQSVSLLEEFQQAELVVIGAPMHNFFIPSTLKAWLDRLLELQIASGERSSGVRVLLITAGCTLMGLDGEAQLLENYENQLRAAFAFMGVGALQIMRSQADLDAALAFASAR